MDAKHAATSGGEEALGCSRVYGMLAKGLRYPAPGAQAGLRDGSALAQLWNGLADLPQGQAALPPDRDAVVRRAGEEAKALDTEHFEARYVAAFDVGFPEPPAPPYEGVYRTEDRSALLLEVSEFYAHFGLRMNKEGENELPDHAVAELEFLHFLAFKEAHAREQGDGPMLKGYLLARKDFLERHAALWLPRFAERAGKTEAPAVHVELARVAGAFAAADLERVERLLEELEGVELPRTPLPVGPPVAGGDPRPS